MKLTRLAEIPKQIWLLILFRFSVGFTFWYGIEKLFLRDELQVGPQGIAYIAAVYMVTTLLLDVPAGVLADRWGRKRTLVLSVVLFIIANILLGASTSLVWYLAATFFWALYNVTIDGTFQALLFDSLKERGSEQRFQKIDALAGVAFMLGVTISSLASGVLAEQVGLREVYYVSILPLFVALGCLFFVREPKVTHDEHDAIIKGYWRHLSGAFGEVIRSPRLRLSVVGMVGLYFILTPLYEFQQYVFIALFDSVVIVGALNGLSGFFLAVGFTIALYKKVPILLLLVAGVTCMGTILVSQNTIALGALAALAIVATLLQNSVSTELQHATRSRTRAAVTSAVNLIGNTMMLPYVFLFGAMAELWSIWLAYGVTAGVLVIIATSYFILMRTGHLRLSLSVKEAT